MLSWCKQRKTLPYGSFISFSLSFFCCVARLFISTWLVRNNQNCLAGNIQYFLGVYLNYLTLLTVVGLNIWLFSWQRSCSAPIFCQHRWFTEEAVEVSGAVHPNGKWDRTEALSIFVFRRLNWIWAMSNWCGSSDSQAFPSTPNILVLGNCKYFSGLAVIQAAGGEQVPYAFCLIHMVLWG